MSFRDQYNFYGKTGRVTKSINNGPMFLFFSADTKEELIIIARVKPAEHVIKVINVLNCHRFSFESFSVDRGKRQVLKPKNQPLKENLRLPLLDLECHLFLI